MTFQGCSKHQNHYIWIIWMKDRSKPRETSSCSDLCRNCNFRTLGQVYHLSSVTCCWGSFKPLYQSINQWGTSTQRIIQLVVILVIVSLSPTVFPRIGLSYKWLSYNTSYYPVLQWDGPNMIPTSPNQAQRPKGQAAAASSPWPGGPSPCAPRSAPGGRSWIPPSQRDSEVSMGVAIYMYIFMI